MTLTTAIILFAIVSFCAALYFGRNKPPEYPKQKEITHPRKRRGF